MVVGLQQLLFKTVRIIAGVTVVFKNRDEMIFHAVVLNRKSNQLEISAQKTGMTSFEELKDFLPAKCPIVLNIEGWGVLVKQGEREMRSKPNGGYLPDNNKDFEYFVYEQESAPFVSIVRKEMLNKVLEDFFRRGFNLGGVAAGPLSIDVLISSLEMEGRLLVGNWAVQVNRHEIVEVAMLQEAEVSHFDIEGESISSLVIGAYSLAVKYASGLIEDEGVNESLSSGFAYRRLSFLVGAFVSVLLFLGLIINFMLFEKYNRELDLVNRDYLNREGLILELKNVEEELHRRKEIVARAGLEGSNPMAWYIDRSVSLMPSQLVLNRLSWQPVSNRIQSGKEIDFEDNRVIIEGETSDVLLVHKWIKSLKDEKWIEDVDLVSYSIQDQQTDGCFSIEVSYYEK